MRSEVTVYPLFLFALLVICALPTHSPSEVLSDLQSQANALKISFEEKLLVTIPNDYKEPGDYGPFAEPGEVWKVIITFEQRGRGWNPVLSPDGEQVMYRAKQGNKQFIVLGDKRGPDFDEVRYPVFSPDGSKLAYSAKLNKKWFIIVGEQKGPEFDEIGPPVFSSDGNNVAYGAREGKKAFIVSNGQRGKEFKQVSSPLFDPTGKSIAYVAFQDDTSYLYVNENLVAKYPVIADVTFSPEGSKTAYVAYKGDWFVVVGEKTSPKYPIALAPTFSPDGEKVAYIASKGGWGGFKYFIVVGDEVGTGFPGGVSIPVFSPDGSKVVYAASKNPKFLEDLFLVSGDKQEKTKCEPSHSIYGVIYTGVENRKRNLFLSPDGSKVVCIISDQGWKTKSVVVSGNQASPKFDEVGIPTFSPDGRKIVFLARQGKEIWRKVMDIQ